MKRKGETRYGSPFTQPLPCEAENSSKESDTVFRMKESQRMRWGVFFFLVHWGAQSLRKGPVCVGCFPQKYLADIFELMHEWYFARCGERPAF